MGFFTDLFGGPSRQQEQLASQQSSLAATLASNYGERFGQQSQIFQNLTNQLTPIANLGPSQQGFSPQELAALNTQAINASGAAARNAAQATGSVLAGQGGGGTSGLVSGIEAQIRGTEASAAANQLASAQNEIVQRNYETGRSNFWNATAGEHNLATAEAPQQYGSLAESTTQSALADENQIQKEKQAAAFAPIGLALKGVGAVMGGFGNLDTTGSSSLGEQVGNFGVGAMNSLGTP